MPPEVLSPRALNRALLSRQLLLDRPDLPDEADGRRAAVISAIEHLVGLQAQAPFPPYYGLWSRLGGFRPEDLASLITDRSVVRIALMRGTIHPVSARDCLPLRRQLQPVLERGLRGTFGRRWRNSGRPWSPLPMSRAPSCSTCRRRRGPVLTCPPRPG